MKRNKSRKSALLMSALSLLTCMTMLIGSTFAWFTDSVTSSGNIIKSGTLKVAMDWADGTKAVPGEDSTDWTDASTGAIFNNDKWEPGYVEVRHIKIENKGTLALKYQLNIAANGQVSDLAKVIDVYFLDPAQQVATRTDLENVQPVGTLADVLAGMPTNSSGELLENNADTVTLALKMRESADNDYQNKKIGSDFAVQLLATQLTSESDSFDNQYDVESGYVAEVKTAEDLAIALTAGGMVRLANDVALAETITVPADATAVLDLNGKQLSGAMAKDAGDLIVNQGTLTIIGNDAATLTNTTTNGGALISNNGTMTLKGGKYIGAPIGTTGYPDYAVYSTGKLTVEKGTSIISDRGALSVSGETVINDGTFEVTAAASSRTLTCHTIYAYGSTLTINGGDFANNYTGVSGASVICPAGSEITIYGGNFHDPVTSTANFNNTANFQNYMGYGKPVNVCGGTYNDSTVNKNLAAGHITVDNGDGTVYVIKGTAAADQSAMEAAFNSGEKTVVLSAGTYEFPNSLVEGATIIGQNGVVFEDTLSGTLNDVTLKNLHIKSGNAQRWAYSHGDLLFEDCTFEATGVYAIHYDGLNGANITYKNCTIIGWAAIGGGAEHVTFDGCTVKGNGTYGVLRLYSPATIKNCTFDVANVNTTDVFQDGIHAVDCKINVSNNTNVNGAMTDIYNLSGTGSIVEE